MPLEFRGQHLEFLNDITPEIDLEGSLSCGKTTVALCKELRMLQKYPGMHSFIGRWTDDATHMLLRPALEQMARIEGVTLNWNDKLKFYDLENGCKIYSFGLKTQSQDPVQRYGKIRGLPVSRIYIDQAEQVAADIASELRARLRPDLEARLANKDYPRQLTFTPNPTNDDHWLAKQFPASNKLKGRRYYSLSLFDNEHNLPPEMIEGLLREYPVEHPKHATVIMGQRGLNVIGDPVYDQLFDRKVHVRPIALRDDMRVLEAFEFGKHNPVWLLAQRSFHGGLMFLGGIIGKRMMLDDFLPIVRRFRSEWLPEDAEIKTCTGPMGTTSGYTLISQITDAGFRPIWREDGNQHDVQLAMIEYIAAELRRRTTAKEEAIGINSDPTRWLSVSADGTMKEMPFLSFAFEGGYVWSEHDVSQANKRLRQPFVDDEYGNAMRCVEHLALNFCAAHLTEDERLKRERQQRQDASFGVPSAASGQQGWMVS